ncbi:alkaline shock response membrane anchor protein AmaP [Companilactobacillus farciminis]|uniref:alkaline shock response membrane anchor protein AmaP n=1 Tax=Companilactobacillus farciminis TaxID=1612 RepID=UPI00232C13EB|nr:alkaline shock response membrane anchor protein AmaP [Companilactobacillus farciminis]WCG36590.1 alkaline shock response membrane anchor protein AmaP [Companilactobacillus farciminis]
MKKANKIILIVLTLIGLLQVFWFTALTYPIKPIINWINSLNVPKNWLTYLSLALAVISTLIYIFILMYALFSPIKYQEIKFTSSNGKLRISTSAVEKMITRRLEEISSLQEVNVQLKILGKKRHAKMLISALSNETKNLPQLGGYIKEIANEQLIDHLNVPIKKTIINLSSNTINKKIKVT